MNMNVNVLAELLDNKFLVKEKAREKGVDENVTLNVIKKIIDANGNTEVIEPKYNLHFEHVINELYQVEIESKTKWRNRMIELANHVSDWSRDKSKVGAVLVSKKGGDITLGFNGFPFGVKDEADRYDEKKIKLNIIVHAEVNAIIAAGARAADAHLYVVGKPICARCAGPIIQSGIKKVFAIKPKEKGSYEPPKDPNATDWEEIGRLAITMLKEAGVECIFYEQIPEQTPAPEEVSNSYRYSDF